MIQKTNLQEYIAHVRTTDNAVQSLSAHLNNVADLTSKFASKFGASNIGYLTGLWHDLGKYQRAFQQRIRILTGYDVEDGEPSGAAPRVDHSSAGGLYAHEKFGADNPITYAIMGHHCGLEDREEIKSRVERKQDLLHEPKTFADKKILNPDKQVENFPLKEIKEATYFYRMIFSALVDADRLDTEAFCNAENTHQRIHHLRLADYAHKLDSFLAAKIANSQKSELNALRSHILAHAKGRASLAPGFFSLTVPTGGGKTLTSLTFAIEHALKHKKDRIIYAIPYTSIIEQTAKVFKEIFGDENVLEHHSSLQPEVETLRNRLLSENWDFPLIVTTNVQLFESLFSRKPSSCRKLHNIVNSVLILDEVQMLPLQYLTPIIHCLKALVKYFRVTVVFCTATQPALKSQQSINFKFDGIDDITELAPNPIDLFLRLKRTAVIYPKDLAIRNSWIEIAEQLCEHAQVLCIVNTRRDAAELFRLMPEGTLHLSASMCAQHRSEVIARIKATLQEGKPIRVVSTQLVEAGVDIDFPVVFRALSGIDNIAQAAGRCNREGRLPTLGKVVVFVPPQPSPPGHLYQCEQAGLAIIQDFGDPLLPENYTRYYEKLLWTRGENLDQYKIMELMATLRFKEIDEQFKLIDNDGMSVLVPYSEGKTYIDTLRKLSDQRQIKGILRSCGRYTVNIPARTFTKLREEKHAELLHDCIGIINREDLYDEQLGLLLHDPFYYKAESLII